MSYGDKTDYPKIDIYTRQPEGFVYVGCTTWARTCAEARERYANSCAVPVADIKAHFRKGK